MGSEGASCNKEKLDLNTLREKLRKMSSWAQENLASAQQEQKISYDRKVKPRKFQVGDEVLLLLPTSESKLLAKWRGPYSILRRVGPVDYEIATPDMNRVKSLPCQSPLKKMEDSGGIG